jgi:hypothetical protein
MILITLSLSNNIMTKASITAFYGIKFCTLLQQEITEEFEHKR